jgi:hypothetical protein
VVIDATVGADQLDRLAILLVPGFRLGELTLDALLAQTSTALVYIARGGVFGDREGIVKLTGPEYAPCVHRELTLLNGCADAEVHGVVRPLRREALQVEVASFKDGPVTALLLPFLDGGDLVQWIGQHATRTGQLGPGAALQVGEHVAVILRNLLRLPRPLVHQDVKPQNVLFPYPDAPVREVTLIDLDASVTLDVPLAEFATAPREIGELLVDDVRGFGELLFMLATGREPPSEGVPNPDTGNTTFDLLVVTCMTSVADERGYVCLADPGLWQQLYRAGEVEKVRQQKQRGVSGPMRYVMNRRSLAGIFAILLLSLVVAVASKLVVG